MSGKKEWLRELKRLLQANGVLDAYEITLLITVLRKYQVNNMSPAEMSEFMIASKKGFDQEIESGVEPDPGKPNDLEIEYMKNSTIWKKVRFAIDYLLCRFSVIR